MKRIITLLSVVLVVCTSAQSQLLWKVSGNGLLRPSYIFGTHHMASSSMIDQVPGLAQAIESCDIVMGEVEQDSLLSQEAQSRMAQAMMAPADSTLDKLFSQSEYRTVEKVFNKYFSTMGVKLSQMNMLKPNAISTQMQAMQAIKYFDNFNAADQIDMAVQTRASQEGKPSAGLESVNEQIDLLFNTPLTEQAAGLLEACRHDDNFQEQSAALSEAYMSQDLERLYAVMTDATTGDSAEQMERLIYSRNRRWAEKLTHIMPERASLVCVGAGHLPGDQGLLQLLRNAGYTVTPVTQ